MLSNKDIVTPSGLIRINVYIKDYIEAMARYIPTIGQLEPL